MAKKKKGKRVDTSKLTKRDKKAVSKDISECVREGYPQKQCVAKALHKKAAAKKKRKKK